MRERPISEKFWPMLRRVSLASALLKLVAIPVNLIHARLLSGVVTAATAGQYSAVLQKGGVILLLLLGVKLLAMLTQDAYQCARSKAAHQCKMLLYKWYLSSPLSLLYQSTAGEANIILNSDFNTVTEKITEVYPALVAGMATVVTYFIFLWIQSPFIAVILLVISMLQAVPPLISKHFFEKYDVTDKELEKQDSDYVLEYCHGFVTIKMLHLKQWCLERSRCLHRQWWRVANRLQATFQIQISLNSIVSNILTYGTYAIVGVWILWGNTQVTVGIEAIALSSSLYAAAKSIFQQITAFALSRTAENRISKFGNPKTHACAMLNSNADVCFTNVSCKLGEKQVFSDLTVSIPLSRGITIIKGENGAGKSTLMKLALGLVEYQKGEIRIGGIRPERLSYDNFPEKIFFLPQEDALYDLTPCDLYEILLPHVQKEQALAILHDWGAQESVYTRKIPTLSGGERKKVFLSLAFAVDPDILIMDEPTNSLDAKSSMTLVQLVKERTKGTILITHNEALMAIGSVIYQVQEGGVRIEKDTEKRDL